MSPLSGPCDRREVEPATRISRPASLRVHRGLDVITASAPGRLESAPSNPRPGRAADPIVILGRIRGIHSNGGIRRLSPVAQRDHGISCPTTASAVQERSVDGGSGPPPENRPPDRATSGRAFTRATRGGYLLVGWKRSH